MKFCVVLLIVLSVNYSFSASIANVKIKNENFEQKRNEKEKIITIPKKFSLDAREKTLKAKLKKSDNNNVKVSAFPENFQPGANKGKRCHETERINEDILGSSHTPHNMPLIRRSAPVDRNKLLCHLCVEAATCKKHGKCEPCNKYCKTTSSTLPPENNTESSIDERNSDTMNEEIKDVPILSARLSEIEEEPVNQELNEERSSFSTVGSFSDEKTITSITKLLNLTKFNNIEKFIILAKIPYSNEEIIKENVNILIFDSINGFSSLKNGPLSAKIVQQMKNDINLEESIGINGKVDEKMVEIPSETNNLLLNDRNGLDKLVKLQDNLEENMNSSPTVQLHSESLETTLENEDAVVNDSPLTVSNTNEEANPHINKKKVQIIASPSQDNNPQPAMSEHVKTEHNMESKILNVALNSHPRPESDSHSLVQDQTNDNILSNAANIHDLENSELENQMLPRTDLLTATENPNNDILKSDESEDKKVNTKDDVEMVAAQNKNETELVETERQTNLPTTISDINSNPLNEENNRKIVEEEDSSSTKSNDDDNQQISETQNPSSNILEAQNDPKIETNDNEEGEEAKKSLENDTNSGNTFTASINNDINENKETMEKDLIQEIPKNEDSGKNIESVTTHEENDNIEDEVKKSLKNDTNSGNTFTISRNNDINNINENKETIEKDIIQEIPKNEDSDKNIESVTTQEKNDNMEDEVKKSLENDTNSANTFTTSKNNEINNINENNETIQKDLLQEIPKNEDSGKSNESITTQEKNDNIEAEIKISLENELENTNSVNTFTTSKNNEINNINENKETIQKDLIQEIPKNEDSGKNIESVTNQEKNDNMEDEVKKSLKNELGNTNSADNFTTSKNNEINNINENKETIKKDLLQEIPNNEDSGKNNESVTTEEINKNNDKDEETNEDNFLTSNNGENTQSAVTDAEETAKEETVTHLDSDVPVTTEEAVGGWLSNQLDVLDKLLVNGNRNNENIKNTLLLKPSQKNEDENHLVNTFTKIIKNDLTDGEKLSDVENKNVQNAISKLVENNIKSGIDETRNIQMDQELNKIENAIDNVIKARNRIETVDKVDEAQNKIVEAVDQAQNKTVEAEPEQSSNDTTLKETQLEGALQKDNLSVLSVQNTNPVTNNDTKLQAENLNEQENADMAVTQVNLSENSNTLKEENEEEEKEEDKLSTQNNEKTEVDKVGHILINQVVTLPPIIPSQSRHSLLNDNTLNKMMSPLYGLLHAQDKAAILNRPSLLSHHRLSHNILHSLNNNEENNYEEDRNNIQNKEAEDNNYAEELPGIENRNEFSQSLEPYPANYEDMPKSIETQTHNKNPNWPQIIGAAMDWAYETDKEKPVENIDNPLKYFGKIIPAQDRSVLINDESVKNQKLPKQVYFIGNGIKLPLKMKEENDGSVQLSVDLEKLCNCKEKTCTAKDINNNGLSYNSIDLNNNANEISNDIVSDNLKQRVNSDTETKLKNEIDENTQESNLENNENKEENIESTTKVEEIQNITSNYDEDSPQDVTDGKQRNNNLHKRSLSSNNILNLVSKNNISKENSMATNNEENNDDNIKNQIKSDHKFKKFENKFEKSLNKFNEDVKNYFYRKFDEEGNHIIPAETNLNQDSGFIKRKLGLVQDVLTWMKNVSKGNNLNKL